MSKSDFGLIGLAVMGQNLVLNVESRGFRVSVYNRTTSVTEEFVAENAGKNLYGAKTLEEFVASIERPRKIMMLVQSKAGANPADRDAVDAVIDSLVPLLEPGDLIIDGGNTYFIHTERRSKELEAKGLLFIGTGVSGGEEGARKGPAIMPGGPSSSWELIKPIFESISAKVNGDPCTRMFAIQHTDTGTLLGACGLCYIDWVNRTADFSLYIGHEGLYIDDNLAPDAAVTMTGYAFDELGLNRLWSEIYAFDEAKTRFFQRLGWQLDGRHRQTHWAEGAWHDSLYFSLLASDPRPALP
jgi:RimJ/RimL family protein N-acetyltransferase